MKKVWLIAGGGIAALYLLHQQGVSNTSGVGDPADTNPDGSPFGGTDAGILDEVQVALNIVPDYINAWADAITIHEGWRQGSRSYRNNNPGNLEIDGDGTPPRDGSNYGVFQSYNAGRNALVADLTAKVRKYGSWTVYAVMARYAPPQDHNDTPAYAAAVAQALGVGTTTQVSAIPTAWAASGRIYTPVSFPSGGAPTPTIAPDPTSNPTLPGDLLNQPLADPTSQSIDSLFQETITGIDAGTFNLPTDGSGG